jgi:polyisoprenoid-binding protein YceI
MTARTRFIALGLLLAALPVAAQDWQMSAGSSLGFSARFQGEAFTGRFTRFTPYIRFDPKNLAQSRFDVSIDLGSADTRNSERDDTLKTAEFFDIKKTPSARYSANSFTALGNGRYRANGTLSLRGVRKPVALLFSWKPGSSAVLQGEATLNRLDFQVGTGDWSDTGLLPNAVKVTTTLVLTAKPPAKP